MRNTIDVLSARAGFVVIDTHARNKEQPPSAGRIARVSPSSSSLSHRSTAGASGRRSAAHGKTTLFYCLDIYVNMLFIGVKDHLRCFADLPQNLKKSSLFIHNGRGESFNLHIGLYIGQVRQVKDNAGENAM